MYIAFQTALSVLNSQTESMEKNSIASVQSSKVFWHCLNLSEPELNPDVLVLVESLMKILNPSLKIKIILQVHLIMCTEHSLYEAVDIFFVCFGN